MPTRRSASYKKYLSSKQLFSAIMKMSIEILSKATIKPSSPTPQELRNFKIAFLDQLAPSSYIPVLLFYKPELNMNVPQTFDHLKTSFAETLTIYYPLAGRFKDSVSIDCNDEGALYVEAQINCSLAQFLESPNIAFLNNFLPCKANCLDKDSETLVAIQITRFQCGGLVIGACLLHKIVDTAAMSSFLNTWGKIARGLRDQVECPDLSSASSLFPPRDSLSSEFLTNFDKFYFKGRKSNNMKRFVFDATAIATLKAQAASKMVPHPSRVVALTAFICKRIMAAHGREEENTSQQLMITHPVNLRRRLEPPLPDNSFGNLLWLAYDFYDAMETHEIELPNLVELVREMLVNVSSENIQGLDSDDVFTSLSEVMGHLNTIENLKILRFTSWCKLGFYDVNFGWGEPVWISERGDTLGCQTKQHFLFVDSKCGKQIELWMDYDEEDISILENDSEFLAYATPNPSVCMD